MIKRPFLFNQPFANRNGFRLHGVEQLLHALALFSRELKLVREFEHMQRAGIAIQLRSQREAHAAAGA